MGQTQGDGCAVLHLPTLPTPGAHHPPQADLVRSLRLGADERTAGVEALHDAGQAAVTIFHDDGQARFYHGDVRAVLATLPAQSVQTCVTSPPYWGLRDYGTAGWDGGDAKCQHLVRENGADHATRSGLGGGTSTTGHQREGFKAACPRCGARRIDAQLGLEATPESYVANMVAVFREVRRVLRDDGTVFLNLGDSYFHTNPSGPQGQNGQRANRQFTAEGLGGGARHEGAYDRRDKERSGFPDHGCACRSLCDGCRAAYRLGRSHSAGLHAPTLAPSPSAPSRERTASASDHLPTWDSAHLASQPAISIPDQPQTSGHADAPLRVSLASNSVESAPPPLASNSGESTLGDECLLCGRSLPHSVQESARKGGCNCDNGEPESAGRSQGRGVSGLAYPHYTTTSLKPKDLVGIPWRVAFALQADGWYLRSDIIWAKPNPMPESVTDRPTKSHEYLFLLTKSARYYYDADAIREPFAPETGPRALRAQESDARADGVPGQPQHSLHEPRSYKGSSFVKGKTGEIKPTVGQGERVEAAGRNKRSVWTIATAPFAEAHFATFPPALVTPCILAGSRPGDTVIDPFLGSGTTAMVAKQLGRKTIGIDLSAEYLALAVKRCRQMGLV